MTETTAIGGKDGGWDAASERLATFPPDVNCGDISANDFASIGSDPHGLDGDGDGVACES